MNTNSDKSSASVDQVESKNQSYGCMFTNSSSTVFLQSDNFENCESSFKIEAITQITHSISNQQECVDRSVEHIQPKPKVKKFSVQLFVIHAARKIVLSWKGLSKIARFYKKINQDLSTFMGAFVLLMTRRWRKKLLL